MSRRRQLKQPQIKQQLETDESYYDQRAPDGWPIRDVPRPLIDVKIGDAAAGQSVGRRIHLFGSVAAQGSNALEPFTQQIAIQTARSTDTRPRMFHVSFFGNELQRFAPLAAPVGPVPESQIQNITGPNTTQVQGRILIQDESGGRILDVDTMGTASIDVYAFAVTVFALVPDSFYSVNTTSAQVIQPDNPSRSGLVIDSMFGARIIPISLNGTSLTKQATRRVTVAGGGSSEIVAVPPGSRLVEVLTTSVADAAASTVNFVPTVNPTVFLGAPIILGSASFIAGETTTRKQMIPNAVGIQIANAGAVPVNYQLTFEVDR